MICRCCGSPRLRFYCPCFDDTALRYLECRACGSMNLSAGYDQVKHAYHTIDYANFFIRYCGSETKLAEGFVQHVEIADRVLPQKGSALDVGCAGGGFLMAAESGGWETWGFDVSESSVRVVEMLPGVSAERVVVAEEFRADLFPKQFDLVHCCEVIEHVESPREMLREIRSALRPGGFLFLQTPTPYGEEKGIWNQIVHLCVMTEDAIRWLLHDEGWVVDERYGLTWMRELARGEREKREIQPAGGQCYVCRRREDS